MTFVQLIVENVSRRFCPVQSRAEFVRHGMARQSICHPAQIQEGNETVVSQKDYLVHT
jgi:hypothetical protein